MAYNKIKLGPFVKGLNTFSDPTSIDDLELTVIENFDLDIDGSLVSRPPITDTGIVMPVGTGTMQLLGFYTSPAGASFLIGSSASSTYYFDGTAWVLITNTFAASAMSQYRDKAWLVAPPSSSNPGGSWDNTVGFTAVATMPKGNCIAVQKERLWIGPGKNVASNGSRIYFCAIADPSTWAGDFISINTGDGQNVLDMLVYFQDLLIFKNDSTYRFSYDTDPALGTISRVSDTVGILDTGCATTFENRIFVLHNNGFYELTNYNYERLNDKVPFMRGSGVGPFADIASVSYFSSRIFVSFYDQLYVWSVQTRTWSMWKSTFLANIGKVLAIPNEQSVNPRAYTGASTIGASKLYSITDAITLDSEPMVCKMVTKNYDYQTSSNFKRLGKWGVDCIALRDVVGTATPVQYSNTITWAVAKLRTWGDALPFTWGRPTVGSSGTPDDVAISGLTGERKFLKFGPESLRFRQIGFTIEINTDGSSSQAPARIFNIITWTTDKQDVVSRVS